MKWAFILALIIVLGSIRADVDLSTAGNQTLSGSTKVISTVGSVTTIIGDESNNTFSPTIKLSKQFFEDSNITISWNTNTPSLGNTNVLIEDKIVKYKRNTYELWFYQLPYGSDPSKGGFEFMAKLDSKPSKNVFSFKIDAPNLDFFYQPPLNEENYSKDFDCTATLCINTKDNYTVKRPENVVGSYAVYHKTKANNQYGTGKVTHIYRPYVSDSLGVWEWANLSIAGNTLTITISQKFLDTATYPIYIDPSFGYTTAGASSTGMSNARAKTTDTYTASAGDTLTQFAYYGRSQNQVTDSFDMVLYTYSGGVPVNKSGNQVRTVPGYTLGWHFVDATFSMTEGTTYTIARGNQTATAFDMYYDSVGTPTQTSIQTNASLLTTWNQSSTASTRFSWYANYTQSGVSFTPAFNITITSPSNGSSYTYPYNFTYNFTAIGNATNYDIKYGLDSNANVTYGNVANDTNIFHSLENLSAGIHSLVIYATNGTVTNTSNNITFTINRTSMPIYQLLNGAWQNLTVTYPTSTNASGYKNIAEGTLVLYRNGTSFSIPNIETLGAGVWNYTLYFAQTENYTANSTSLFVTVNQNNSYSLNIGIVPSTTITFGTQTTVTGSGCPSGVTCTLYRNGIGVTNPYTSTEGAGSINFEYNTSGNTNYSSKTVSQALTVNKYTQFCNATIDGVWQNKTITYGTSAIMNGSSSNVSGLLYRNGTSVSYPQTITSGVGVWNYTFYSAGNANFTSCTETVFLTVNKAAPSLSVTLSPSDTVIYPRQTTATGVGCTAPLTCTLYRDITTVASPDINSYNVGAYNYIYNTTGNENYSAATASNLLTVNQNTTWYLNITAAPSSIVTFGTQTTLTGINCPAELTCNLYNNGILISNPDIKTLGVASYIYTYNTTGNSNYGSRSTVQSVTVNIYTQTCTVLIDGVNSDKSVAYLTSTNATGVATNLSGTLYRNGTGVANPEIGAIATGDWNYTYISDGNVNYSVCSATHYLHVSGSPDVNPPIINITSPLNQTYSQCSHSLLLNATANESVVAWWYQLNNSGTNVSFNILNYVTVGNGTSFLQIWANDSASNVGTSNVTFFFNESGCIPITPANGTGGNKYYITQVIYNGEDNFARGLALGAILLAILVFGFNKRKELE
jgi:hypothetical protein